MKKSSVEDIRSRFDKDVERFSNLDTGQVATVDAVISLEMITDAAKALQPNAKKILDLGCGAGNYTLKLLSKMGNLDCTLIDLSGPMLERAKQRVAEKTLGKIEVIQGDIREIELPKEKFDVIMAGAVLHHLREEEEWELVFTKLYDSLNQGGGLYISDLILQESPRITDLVWDKYRAYLASIGGNDYAEKVLAYIELEDSPRSINFQLNLMQKVGFTTTEVFHKNLCFGAFGGIK
ncbi:class I SAM-dependent methyltransferase [Pararhodonellum marinum]|uniref:class I SAM-dependent methyltransferase n=1 Tax=Pararhodonellum marinum TaxID=2755358 RepID=UPI00188E6394|nr:class I SAM-dependent methyltransferase [Pararhodonellum marinum]